MLKMKAQCERCEAPTPLTGVAYICSFECNFCESCTLDMQNICPNCAGELLRRPTRLKTPANVATNLIRKKISAVFPFRR